MRSMTGYASAAERNGERDLRVEVRSLNNRYLDISVSMPSFLLPLEAEIKRVVAGVARRGKVEVTIHLREFVDSIEMRVDTAAVGAAIEALNEVARLADIQTAPTVGDVLRFEGIIQPERLRDPESYREALIAVLERALASWDEVRSAEGEATKVDICRQIDRIRDAVDVFLAAAPEVERQIFDAVQSRFRDVLGDEADEQRIYAEAATLIVKHSTNEELVRLQSHLEGFDRLLETNQSVGKRIDFLCQEINREINTTAGKTILPEVQHAVVDAKDAVEAIREQVRNLE